MDYTPYKVWAISFDNKLAVNGRENEGLHGWGFHVSVMVKSGSNPDDRWVIDLALFHSAVGVDEWKNLLTGWDNTSEGKFGEPPLIDRNGKSQKLFGSYVPFISNSDFPYYILGIKVRGTIDEEANQAICTKKKESALVKYANLPLKKLAIWSIMVLLVTNSVISNVNAVLVLEKEEVFFRLHLLKKSRDQLKLQGEAEDWTTLQKVDLSSETMLTLTEKDIESYNWPDQFITLTLESSMKLLSCLGIRDSLAKIKEGKFVLN